MKIFGSKKATVTTYAPILMIVATSIVGYFVSNGSITEDIGKWIIGSVATVLGVSAGTYNSAQGKVDAAIHESASKDDSQPN